MKKITRFLASLAAIFVMMLLCEVSVFAYSTTRSNTQDITYITRKNMKVTFTVENGTFEDESTDPIAFSVPYGKTLSLNQIPTNMKPAAGYTAHGSWSPAIPDTSTEITKDITYTYNFRPPVVTYHANAKDAVFAGGKDTHIVGYIQNDKTNKNDVAKGYEYQDPSRKTYRLMIWNYTPDGTGKTYLSTDMSPLYNRDDCKVYDLYAIWDSPAPTKMNATNSCNN